MGNGKWEMENGKWEMENGEWRIEKSELKILYYILCYVVIVCIGECVCCEFDLFDWCCYVVNAYVFVEKNSAFDGKLFCWCAFW